MKVSTSTLFTAAIFISDVILNVDAFVRYTPLNNLVINERTISIGSPIYSSNNDETPSSSRIKRRRRRKQPQDVVAPEVAPDSMEDEVKETLISSNKADFVDLEIKDLLTSDTPPGEEFSFDPQDDSEDGDGDDLKRLLADAKRLRGQSDEVESQEPGFGSSLKEIFSTIVTIDFFVICGFLVWFIAGVFCSVVLKNDTVQIAFNGIFQPLVQPALGILMIGSLGSALTNSED